MLATLLPTLIDHLTPHGKVPDQGGVGNHDDLLASLSGLLQQAALRACAIEGHPEAREGAFFWRLFRNSRVSVAESALSSQRCNARIHRCGVGLVEDLVVVRSKQVLLDHAAGGAAAAKARLPAGFTRRSSPA
jgi:hypothetical protein